jgi:RNA-directed DNA polymerase
MDMINDHIQDGDLRHYLYQVISRCVEFGGEYRDIEGGISRGCPLSPILGALYLQALDEQFAEQDVFYIRYMDDILILTRTRWHNRRAVRQAVESVSGYTETGETPRQDLHRQN